MYLALCVIHTRERNIFIDGERGAFAARHQRTLFLTNHTSVDRLKVNATLEF